MKTRAHVSLRILIRGVPLGEGATFDLAGYRAIVILVWSGTRAKTAHFPDVTVERGDLEAVVLCDPGTVTSLMSALATDPRVVAVEAPGVADTRPPPPKE